MAVVPGVSGYGQNLLAFERPGNALCQVATCAAYSVRLAGMLGVVGKHLHMHLWPKVHLGKRQMGPELVSGPCWLVQVVVGF